MLQPVQLQDVSVSYQSEIAELRSFLAKAGVPLDSAETLGGIALRLREDRAFRRDLISYGWVVLHLSGRQISYSDLLGILAVAAAGTRFAAAADETDAHDLLRFLMEAREAFDTKAAAQVPARRPAFVAAPVAAKAMPSVLPVSEPVRALRYVPEATFSEEEEEPERRTAVWVAAAACLVAALLLGLWLHYRPADRGPAPTVATVAPAVSAEKDSEQPIPHSETSVAKSAPAPVGRRSPREMPDKSTAGTPREASQAPAPIQRRPAPAQKNSAPVVASARPATPVMRLFVVPKVPPARPAAAADETAEEAPQPFKLLRRPGAGSSAGDSNLVAESHPLDPLGNSRAGTTSTVRGGTVHPTSLGAMAANVMYSPAPAYPQAASAAHVQGEVKLEAEVDSDGNVTSARVISGPPLLREAATDALEHWRYKPYMYEGKPISMNALVVMDFKLP
jgi:TonB family protein